MDLRATGYGYDEQGLTSSGVLPRIPDPQQLDVGARVRRSHPWDGSRRAGQAVGPELTVVKFYNYGELALVELSDGTHAFAWTLVPCGSATAKLA
jgi:hypothetical protein